MAESIKTVKLDETARGPSGAPDERRAPRKPGFKGGGMMLPRNQDEN